MTLSACFRSMVATAATVCLLGCSNIPIPPDSELSGTYTQVVAKPYQDVYRAVAKQMRACYRAITILGNGWDVQADLDALARTGRIEVYDVGLTGAKTAEASKSGRLVIVESLADGTRITTSAARPRDAYMTHLAIPGWLLGVDSCFPKG